MYTRGDATQPHGEGPKVIIHVCNDIGAWGAGFVLAISRRWGKPEAKYREWFRQKDLRLNLEKGQTMMTSGVFGLGEVQLVQVEPEIYIINMVAQKGIGWEGGIPLQYDMLEKCLSKVKAIVSDIPEWGESERGKRRATIHAPRFGCGLAGSNWRLVGPIVEKELEGMFVTIYDF